MLFLSSLSLPDAEAENSFFLAQRRTCYDSFYPFQIFPQRGLRWLEFSALTILYGGNGSGKSTVLNILAEALGLEREAPYNRSAFFGDYLRLCHLHTLRPVPPESRIITSDDVFDFMLSLRALNEGIDHRRDRMFEEVLEARYSHFQFHGMEDYDRLKQVSSARRLSQSQYVRKNLVDNIRTYSNGESALRFFTQRMGENALYLLDEPENSLSAARQQDLAGFLADSARFYGCQLVVATHSPFLLAMPGAVVYDLDADPVRPRRWTELETVRAYRDFFRDHEAEFQD